MTAMTRSEAVSFIQEGLGFRTDRETEIINRLKQAQRLLEMGRTLPKFLLTEDDTLSATTGTVALTLPDGFIREKQDETLHLNDATTGEAIFLEKIAFDVGTLRFGSADAGQPQAYVLRQSTILILPERDTTYSLTWSYYTRADILDSNITNAWLTSAPDILIGRAGMIAAKDFRQKEALEKFTELYTTAWTGAIADDILRDQEAKPLRMGARL